MIDNLVKEYGERYLTREDVRELLEKRIKYKPEYTFRVMYHDEDEFFKDAGLAILVVEMTRLDSKCFPKKRQDSTLHITQIIPGRLTISMFIYWLTELLTRLELHERDEFLRCDGRHVFDPHQLPDGTRTTELRYNKILIT